MGSKGKGNKKKRMKKQTMWLILGSAGVLAVAAWIYISGSSQQFTTSGKRLVYTLDPRHFSSDSKAQAAYQVAKDMPEVLAELPCFCGCMTSFGHESNLFCFRDEHGAACEICEGIALEARDEHEQGWSIERIKQSIQDHFGRSH